MIEKVFGKVDYIDAGRKESENEIAFTTSKASESRLSECVSKLGKAGSVREVINVIRIEGM